MFIAAYPRQVLESAFTFDSCVTEEDTTHTMSTGKREEEIEVKEMMLEGEGGIMDRPFVSPISSVSDDLDKLGYSDVPDCDGCEVTVGHDAAPPTKEDNNTTNDFNDESDSNYNNALCVTSSSTTTSSSCCRLAPESAMAVSSVSQSFTGDGCSSVNICDRTALYIPDCVLQFEPPPEAIKQIVHDAQEMYNTAASGNNKTGSAVTQQQEGGRNGEEGDKNIAEDHKSNVDVATVVVSTEDRKRQGVRKIFGTRSLDNYETEAIDELKQYLNEQQLDLSSTIFDNDRMKLRFLQGNEWDNERCREDMVRHLHWREQNLPVLHNDVRHLLPLGYFYIHGRDMCMRPVLYIRCKQLNTAQPDEAMKVIVYWLEFLISSLLVENRVEQWRVVVDMAECALYNMPMMVLKEVTMTLAKNYRGRLHHMAIINAPLVFWGLWQLVSIVLSPTTRAKIFILSGNYQKELLQHIAGSQLEQKYGGSQEDTSLSEVMAVMPPNPPTPTKE
eukprot:GHVS01042726.1.p1 GENE.GHVS01042726.1~~GHVS01042726.1.p1  ORF type:complete len:501 (-),score=87.35 GHVS01042726.1:333-1835(-)